MGTERASTEVRGRHERRMEVNMVKNMTEDVIMKTHY